MRKLIIIVAAATLALIAAMFVIAAIVRSSGEKPQHIAVGMELANPVMFTNGDVCTISDRSGLGVTAGKLRVPYPIYGSALDGWCIKVIEVAGDTRTSEISTHGNDVVWLWAN